MFGLNLQDQRGNALGAGFDLNQKQFRKGAFAPAHTQAALLQSPEMNAYLNQERSVLPLALQGIFGGEASAQREASTQAQQAGLGRGYLGQILSSTRFANAGAATQARLGAKIGDVNRQASAAARIAQAISGGQQALFLRKAQRRQSTLQKQFTQRFANVLEGFASEALSGISGSFAGLTSF